MTPLGYGYKLRVQRFVDLAELVVAKESPDLFGLG
jgi:hypothetical protein